MTSPLARRWMWRLAAVLAGFGAVLVAVSVAMPALTDPEAFERGYSALLAEHYGDTEGFFRLLAKYETPKWRLQDIGLSLLAVGGVAGLVAWIGPERVWRTQRRLLVLLPVTAAGLALLMGGLLADPLLRFEREQLPSWADSVAIPLFWTYGLMSVVAPVVAMLALAPLLRGRTAPAGLSGPSPRGRWIAWTLVSLVYLCPILIAALLVATAIDPGGWLTASSGAILGWLMLNARALWLAPKV